MRRAAPRSPRNLPVPGREGGKEILASLFAQMATNLRRKLGEMTLEKLGDVNDDARKHDMTKR